MLLFTLSAGKKCSTSRHAASHVSLIVVYLARHASPFVSCLWARPLFNFTHRMWESQYHSPVLGLRSGDVAIPYRSRPVRPVTPRFLYRSDW